ncbi:MAG: UDP-N-acetylmuramoyl-tripeptide--D-alanyl-D-alanine ligase [Bacteroidales bacterium]|nr:UDP-N-acetylmuramoyl-tripeptide--D-alanyl-D-alanine ligase [Bacteroidales bacterium]
MTLQQIYSVYLSCGGRVTTDSRAIKGGEFFIALKGENFDGNEYAAAALQAGAAYALVNADSRAASSGDSRMIAVEDTYKALCALATHHRLSVRPHGQPLTVLSLTGTNGKTTTKELIRSVLSAKYKVTATEGNLNNNIGVPLSLLKITEETELAVIEMGASHPGDIRELVDIALPDMGLITNVGKAHLLGFSSFEGVKATKGELYDYIASKKGKVFVNLGNPHLVMMAALRGGLETIPYGSSVQHASLLPASPEEPFLRMLVDGVKVRTNLVGSYNADNVLCAMAVGAYFGVDAQTAADAVAAFVPSNNRSQMQKAVRNTLIVDAYNANPSSMDAALDNFASVVADRKLALLGDMRELGDDSVKEHVKVLRKVEKLSIPAMFVGDEFGKALELSGMDYPWFKDSDALAAALTEVKDTLVLVKGSRGIRMEKAIPAL